MATPTKSTDGGEADAGQSRPSTPKLALFSGGSLRRLGSKLSVGGLSPKARQGSPLKGPPATVEGGHVTRSPLPLRARRGSLKPLSIVTTAFHPLDFDPVATMEAVRQQTPPSSPSPSALSSMTTPNKPRDRAIIDNMEMFGKQVEPFPPVSLRKSTERDDDQETIRPARSSSQLARVETNHRSTSHPHAHVHSHSHVTPHRSTSFGIGRNENNERVITGNFASLLNLPPPDLSQHPMFQSDPHLSKSDAPLMQTTSSVEEIRKWALQKRKYETEHGELVRTNTKPPFIVGNAFAEAAATGQNPFTTPERKEVKTDKPLGLRTNQTGSPHNPIKNASNVNLPDFYGRKSSETTGLRSKMSRLHLDRDNGDAHIFDVLAEDSPFTKQLPQLPKTPSGSQKTGFSSFSSDFESKKTGLRKVSHIFKPKAAIDKSVSDLSLLEPAPLDGFSNWYRPDMEFFLRRTLNSWSRDYNEGDPKPRHPNTGKGWFSRNLKCTTCMENCCAICKRACCAYKAAVLGLENHKNNPPGYRMADERVHQITTVFPYGKEAPTFLQCTMGDETGCGKMICPDCCGQCPNEDCLDIQCRRCKKDPWSACLWHDEEANANAL